MLINVLDSAFDIVAKLIPPVPITLHRVKYSGVISKKGVINAEKNDLLVTKGIVQPLSSHELSMFDFSSIDAYKSYKIYILKKNLENESFLLTGFHKIQYDYTVSFYDPYDNTPYSHYIHGVHDWSANGWVKLIVYRRKDGASYENNIRHGRGQ